MWKEKGSFLVSQNAEQLLNGIKEGKLNREDALSYLEVTTDVLRTEFLITLIFNLKDELDELRKEKDKK